MKIKELYELIKARRDSAVNDLMRLYNDPHRLHKSIHILKGEIQAYNSILNEMDYYHMVINNGK